MVVPEGPHWLINHILLPSRKQQRVRRAEERKRGVFEHPSVAAVTDKAYNGRRRRYACGRDAAGGEVRMA